MRRSSNPQVRAQRDGRTASWLDIASDTEEGDDDFLLNHNHHHRHNTSPLLSPTSPWVRPRAPTPLAAANDDSNWSPTSTEDNHCTTTIRSFATDSAMHSPLLRSVSESQASPAPNHAPSAHSFARPPKGAALPDPSQFPDPYPFRPCLALSVPALTADSSSSSTRSSSAYTSSGTTHSVSDQNHIRVASGDDENSFTHAITPHDVDQLLIKDDIDFHTASEPRISPQSTENRWSVGTRSRSSSMGQSLSVTMASQDLSQDLTWDSVDERDEIAMSEDETDDDHLLGIEEDEEEEEEERTYAVVIAEQGKGLIVQADDVPVVSLQVHAGTTHLLIGSSSTPNAMPPFLASTIPQICDTLLALDISANFLGALPPCLALCANLEELNIASNPLRVIPVFLCDLTNLRVLIADCTGITTLPDTLAELDKLHTLSIRRNKLHALPSWLCLLSSLQTLYVDGNNFQGPWKALVEPLLAKIPATPIYPLSTPTFPLPSASTTPGSPFDGDSTEQGDDYSDPSSSEGKSPLPGQLTPADEEEYTITPDRAPSMSNRFALPMETPPLPSPSSGSSLTRTRTAPNRNFVRSKSNRGVFGEENARERAYTRSGVEDDKGYFAERELRKMKSTGELRRGQLRSLHDGDAMDNDPSMAAQARPAIQHSMTATSFNAFKQEDEARPMVKRFASMGPGSSLDGSPNIASRPLLTQSLWEQDGSGQLPAMDRISYAGTSSGTSTPQRSQSSAQHSPELGEAVLRHKTPRKEKTRWGFLKKMSMGKMNSTSRPVTPQPPIRPRLPGPSISSPPQIDLRFSTAGTLNGLSTSSDTSSVIITPHLEKKASRDALRVPSAISLLSAPASPNLLAPPSPMQRPAKRRSFLPIDGPNSIAIPDSSAFVPGVTATNDEDHVRTPSPHLSISTDADHSSRKDEERAKEAYMRALRSVMAYLKDMHDLTSQQQSLANNAFDEPSGIRSRRPTILEREGSVALSGTTLASEDSQLRSADSISGIRSGSSIQTFSVATTDSSGSGSEERKFKDDRSKRAMVVREIVETERTYVKGLEELMDIYIKPASAPVNVLGSSSKESVVPVHERKIVFSGVESLFYFHRDNFLPSLEKAAAPLMAPVDELFLTDADGELSLNVAKDVGNAFVRHAAFMRMYSTYINNFDNSVQRVKHWTTPPQASTSPNSAASSTSQLVGLGLTMSAISAPGMTSENSATQGAPNLSTSQRKRIKQYLKRCRMSPRHSQLNLEGYLLLPVQRIPRYRLLLEGLLKSSPATYEYMEDPVDRALAEIAQLANNMNEGKRESESRRKLVHWQQKIRGKFPSPLVQPHRRLIMDGPLLLTRVVRKAMVSFEAINAQGDTSTVQVDCLAPELTPRSLIGILCNDLLVLCRDPSNGKDPNSFVDLWAVLRMQTLPQPASIVHGNALRLVDSKAILYFNAPSPSDALNWYRAINLHIPASKS